MPEREEAERVRVLAEDCRRDGVCHRLSRFFHNGNILSGRRLIYAAPADFHGFCSQLDTVFFRHLSDKHLSPR